MEAINGNFLGAVNFSQIKSKADAMKYAFDITIERNYSTGAVMINKDKAMEVYETFVENMTLPDVTEDNKMNKFMDKYISVLQSSLEKNKESE